MKVYLLRHGRTAYTDQHRYQGQRDIPLSAEGEAEVCPADFSPETVWVSPLSRARRTAELMFPGVEQQVEQDLREMDFGAFEGRSYVDMEDDADYRAWVEGGCWGRCPGGEDRRGFCWRICGAVGKLVDRALTEGKEELVIVAHGGVLMAAMEGFALPEKDYFDWQTVCCGGYLLETDEALWRQRRKLRCLEKLKFTKNGGT